MKSFKFKIGGKAYEASVNELEGSNVEVTINGKSYSVEVEQAAAPKAAPRVAPSAAAAPVAAPAGGSQKISAPLPGNVTKVLVSAGQSVKKGDVLLVMEAMKMENNITAEFDCKVSKVVAQVGQTVNQGDVLVEVEGAAAPVAAPKPVAAPTPKANPAPAPKPAAAPSAGGKKVESPLPGTITKICVTVGQKVNAGDVLLTMEAMKMENNITAESAGEVKAIFVQQGASVMNGDALVEIG